jgi:hypothetical protein
MPTEENLNLTQKVDTLYKLAKEGKLKKLKLPRRAKVSKRKIKKGYIGIIRIDENGNFTGERQQVVDSTYKVKSGVFHALEGDEIGFWNGRYPVVFQPSWRNSPLKLRQIAEPVNETNIQKYIFNRMQTDAIKTKRSFGWIIWVVIIIAIVVAISYFTKKGGV